MVNRFLLLGCLFASFSVLASAEVIVVEEFETDGDGGIRYLSSAFTDGTDHFNRHNYAAQNPHPSHDDQSLLSTAGTTHAEWAWAMEDITESSNPLGLAGLSILRLNDVDVSEFDNLTVTIEIASIYNTTLFIDHLETSEGFDVQVAFNSLSGGTAGAANPTLFDGTYTTIGSFRGQGQITDPSLAPHEVASGTVLSNQLQDFTFDVTGTGVLSVQVVAISLDASDELVFDNIRIEGDRIPEPSVPLLMLSGLSAGLLRRRRSASAKGSSS